MNYLDKMEDNWLNACDQEEYVRTLLRRNGKVTFDENGTFDPMFCKYVINFADLISLAAKMQLVVDFKSMTIHY